MSITHDAFGGRESDDESQRDPEHPAIELVITTGSENGSAIYHPDELHDPEIAEPWILVEPEGGLVHVLHCR